MTRKEILTALRKTKIHTVTCEYDGESDSGQLEACQFLNRDEQIITLSQTAPDLDKAVHDLFYEHLNEEESGWANDDGAKGIFAWDITKNTIIWTHEEREIEYHYHPRKRKL